MHPIPACCCGWPGKSRALSRVRHVVRLLGLSAVSAGCGAGDDPGAPPAAASFLPDNSAARKGCLSDGLVRARIYGALAGDVRWTGDAMDCDGMPRRGAAGVRLRFAGTADGVPLALILGVDEIGPRETAVELPTNVTLIEEGRGRFFSTSDAVSCWTDIERQVAVDPDGGRYAISGTLYCISPLAEVNGPGSVSIPELRFSGIIDWETS